MFYRHYVLSERTGPYVVGVDAGGTNTRAAVVSLDGIAAGRGTGPGANPNSGGELASALSTALRAAVAGLHPPAVVGGVFGIAGAGAAGRPRAVKAASEAWHAAGLPGEPHVVTDIAVAYAAGTAAPAGLVVFAGTGAGAAVIEDGAIVRRVDAYGWLVGDEGSAVWLGREAVRAALRAYDGRGAPTVLAETVPRTLLGEAGGPLVTDVDLRTLRPGGGTPSDATPTDRSPAATDRSAPGGADGAEPAGSGPDRAWPAMVPAGSGLPQAIIKEVYARPPAELGRLAPVVGAAAEAGDAVAARITGEAAALLLADVDALRSTLDEVVARGRAAARGEGGPGLVVAGALLREGPVANAVTAGLRERFGVEPSTAGDGALGAARLAVRLLER